MLVCSLKEAYDGHVNCFLNLVKGRRVAERETLMKTYSAARDRLFLGSTFMAIVNVVLVILSAIHHKDPWVRLPLFTILLAVVTIWWVSARFGNELGKVCSEGSEKTGLRLQNGAHTMAFMANIAILSALPLLH
jgi:hypothetical protein